jgi:signal transduction histidine kinase
MEYEKIFDELNFPFLVWKRSNEKSLFECHYSNKKIIGINKGTLLEEHTNDKIYKEVLETKSTKKVDRDAYSIFVEYISENTLCEIHYPICNNIKILSIISHKIRLPLTSIVGVLNILDDFKFNNEQKKYIDILKRASNDIISIANDILDILNLEQGHVVLKNKQTDIRTIFEACQKIVNNKNKNKKINFKFKIDNNIMKKISIDAPRLEQIIINILNNSVYSTDEFGQIYVIATPYEETQLFDCPFEYQKTSHPKVNLLFRIKDTGSGIDDAKKSIIEDFVNEKSTDINMVHKLSGFGLYISKKLCNLMGGNIWFKTEKDIGSVFYFNIICDGVNV